MAVKKKNAWTKYEFIFTNGESMQLTENQTFDKLRKMGARSWKRIGRFSVIEFRDESLAIGEMYDGPCPKVPRDSEFWERSKRDRLGQLRNVEYLLRYSDHILKNQVMQDIQKEFEVLAA